MRHHELDGLLNALFEDDDLVLDAVDFLLHTQGPAYGQADSLERALREAGSAWKVVENVGEPGYRLEERVDPTVAAATVTALAAGRPGQYLREAWTALYGRQPNPDHAYGEAVKAVEAAARPVLAPNDSSATLGKMVGQLKAQPVGHSVALKGFGDSGPGRTGDVDAITIARLMAQLLWTGQHDRHGDFNPSRPISVSKEEAEAAVHLAVLLVQWLSSGAMK